LTGDEVEAVYIMKGYKVDTDTYLEVFKDELENVAPVSTRTIEIDEFVPRKEIGDSLKGNRKAACPAKETTRSKRAAKRKAGQALASSAGRGRKAGF
jgi:non-homologous end joining protein Ku